MEAHATTQRVPAVLGFFDAPSARGLGYEDMGGKADTQDRIIQSALRLFGEGGYNGTSVAAIAEAAGVSASAVFWHFGDKATLFAEVCKRMLVPFLESITTTYEHLEPADQIFEMFSTYERFVTSQRETIETFVRWVLESKELRASLSGQLFGLQDIFTRKIESALTASTGDPDAARELAAGLITLLDGNLLLTLLDTDPANQARRRAGLLRLAALAATPAHGEAVRAPKTERPD